MSLTPGRVLSVNVAAAPSPTGQKESGLTGFGKAPTDAPIAVRAPGPKGTGGSGMIGDTVHDLRHHGGDDQAVYAYAREDLDWWEHDLGRTLPAGSFGENLTTHGLDLTGALVGERWRIGEQAVLEVACPRIPCTVFAERMGVPRWIKRFTRRGVSGAYLRVVEPGSVRAGDPVEVLSRPEHTVTLGMYFRALTTEPALLPGLMAAGDALPLETRASIARRTAAVP